MIQHIITNVLEELKTKCLLNILISIENKDQMYPYNLPQGWRLPLVDNYNHHVVADYI